MFDKLANVERRYEEITERLSSGNLETRELTALAKEQSSLREVVETYRVYRKIKQDIADNKEMLADSDAELRDLAKQELINLESELPVCADKLKILLLPKDPDDDRGVIVEVRAGTGGDEAGLFAGELFRAYLRYAETKGWRCDFISGNATDKGGFKEAVVAIEGPGVFARLKHEAGVHRVQRVPATEASGRVHTSAVSVAVLAEAEEIEVKIPELDIRIDVFRAGGHGGQSVNTTDSAVRLTHIPTGLVVICQDEKSQHKNKAKALKVLRARLYEKMRAEREAQESALRKGMVGSGDRSEKIRTYNFPQSRVTDHRIGLTTHDIEGVMSGKLDPILDALITAEQAELLKNAGQNDV